MKLTLRSDKLDDSAAEDHRRGQRVDSTGNNTSGEGDAWRERRSVPKAWAANRITYPRVDANVMILVLELILQCLS